MDLAHYACLMLFEHVDLQGTSASIRSVTIKEMGLTKAVLS